MDIIHTTESSDSVLRSINESNSKRLSKLLGRKAALKLAPADLAVSLLEAVKQSKAACIPPILQCGADPNCVDQDGKPPILLLMEANGDPGILRDLLKAGSSPNKAAWQSDQTALHVAGRKGHQVAVKMLLAAGAKPNRPDVGGNTALIYAAKEGHLTALRMLLREDANTNLPNNLNETPLHLAARNGHLECVADLMQVGADPNLRDTRGQTALLLALKAGQMAIVDFLLSCHCDVNAQDLQTGKTVLHWAVQIGDMEILQSILKMDVLTNTRDNNWETPVMYALNAKRKDILELLLRFKCDVTAADKNFNTAMHIAAREGLYDIVPMLKDAGLDVNLKGAGGVTPLMLASGGGHSETVAALLKHGANPNVVDKYRATPLVYAIFSEASEDNIHRITKMLIRAGCNVDENANLANILKKSEGICVPQGVRVESRLYSPLEMAFLAAKPAVFLMLISAGCGTSDIQTDTMRDATDPLGHKHMDFRTSLHLFKVVQSEKKRVKGLQELCRRPALRALTTLPHKRVLMRSLSSELKTFLNMPELEKIEKSFQAGTMAPSTRQPRLASISESNNTSAFSRDDGRRVTIHTYGTIGRQKQTVNAPNSPSTRDDLNFKRTSQGTLDNRGSNRSIVRTSSNASKTTRNSPATVSQYPSWSISHSNNWSNLDYKPTPTATPRSGRSTPVNYPYVSTTIDPSFPMSGRSTPTQGITSSGYVTRSCSRSSSKSNLSTDQDYSTPTRSVSGATTPKSGRSTPTTQVRPTANSTRGWSPSLHQQQPIAPPPRRTPRRKDLPSDGTQTIGRNGRSRTVSRDTGFESDSLSPGVHSPASSDDFFTSPLTNGGTSGMMHANIPLEDTHCHKRDSTGDSVFSDTASDCSHSSQESKKATSSSLAPERSSLRGSLRSRIPVPQRRPSFLAAAVNNSFEMVADEGPGYFIRSRSTRKF